MCDKCVELDKTIAIDPLNQVGDWASENQCSSLLMYGRLPEPNPLVL
jgi:hypothetical protein